MPARGLAPIPRAYLASGDWPKGTLVTDAPFEAHHVAGVARRLLDAIGERSLRSVAREADVSIGTLSNLVGGRTWGDVVTVARLERCLGVSLWCEGVHGSEGATPEAQKGQTGRSGADAGRSDLGGRPGAGE